MRIRWPTSTVHEAAVNRAAAIYAFGLDSDSRRNDTTLVIPMAIGSQPARGISGTNHTLRLDSDLRRNDTTLVIPMAIGISAVRCTSEAELTLR